MRKLLALGSILAVCSAARGAEAARPLTSLPYAPGLDVDSMDRSVNPCTDFYAYSCNGWMARNPIPPDQASWHVYRKMADENRQFLWGILQQAAASPDGRRSAAERKAGDYFAACMDEGAVEAVGAGPLRQELEQIRSLRSAREIAPLLGRLHPSLGNEILFGIGSEQDARDSRQVIAVLDAGGLGLPDRDYYLSDEPRMEEARSKYRDYLVRLLELTGDAPDPARAAAERVLRMETALARATLSRVDRRDPYNVYHRVSLTQLGALTPAFDWSEYLRAGKAPPIRFLNLSEPAFFLQVEVLLENEPLGTWKEYLRARLADARAPYLSREFQRAAFEFHAAYLSGVKEEQPRWKKCVGWVDRDLGEALGQIFVARVFPPEVKAHVLDMTRRIQAAMATRIRESTWMTEPTRRAALEKLGAMKAKIGYPDRWRDYGKLRISPTDFAGNVNRATRFETARELSRIGRPVDRGEWIMTPPTVNAYYDQQKNDINFPAGVLLPPLWDPRMDLAPGYGDTGSTIGHELTHAFDDDGRQYDARGNLRDWWTPQDAEAFRKRAACVIDQFGRYPVVDDIKINSRLTIGEDIADLGGAILAWMAWKDATRDQTLEARDGLTPEQRFFVGMAQWSCENETDESKRLHAATDPHSPSRWRVNGLVANMPQFRQAFSCPAGSPMAPEKVCQVW
jgi:endothelin-converting enzyme/putative endopeptidase